jgi:hypothetical protein
MVRSRRNVNRKAICAVSTQKKHNDNGQVIIYSQNVHGIFENTKEGRTYWKLEYIIKKMETDKIDIYLMCETWDEGNYMKNIRGYTMFHHNNEEKKRRQGVAIILSPRIT